MRILSLLPAATEIVYLLGLEKYLVGVSHACDYPPEAKKKPKVTSSEVSNSMNSREIDKRVKLSLHRGSGVFHIREGVLKKLKPNLILTQELCEVCAIGFNQVKKAARVLESRDKNHESRVEIVSLEPESVEDILENIRLVGEVGGRKKKAEEMIQKLKMRIKKVEAKVKRDRPRVLVIEWLDPLMSAGHWVPEMVEIAGGKNLLTKRGKRSKIITIDQIRSVRVDILVISPCGFDIKRTIKEQKLIEKIVRAVRAVRVELMDGNAYMTRPGPRIIDGIEILSEILHPEIFPKRHSQKD